jgi:hypothetical protein
MRGEAISLSATFLTATFFLPEAAADPTAWLSQEGQRGKAEGVEPRKCSHGAP